MTVTYTERRLAFRNLVDLHYQIAEVRKLLQEMADCDPKSDVSSILRSIWERTDQLHSNCHYLLLNEAEREEVEHSNYTYVSKLSYSVYRDLMNRIEVIDSDLASVCDDEDTVQRCTDMWGSVDDFYAAVSKHLIDKR